MNIKQCIRCREAKPVAEFYQVQTGDGYSSKCKKCSCMYQLDYFIKNEEKIKAYRKEYGKTYKRKPRKKKEKLEHAIPNGFQPITDYPNYYVSRDSDQIWSKKSGKLLAVIRLNHGYLASPVMNENGKKLVLIHRMIALTFIDNPNNLPCVNHINGVRDDNRLENLEWVSHKENIQHAIRLGLIKPKEKGVKRKRLTREQVLEVRNNPDNLTQVQLAAKLGVSKSTICGIHQGRHYTNI